MHIQSLFSRYGSPLYIFNLIKQQEKKPREIVLLKEFEECVDFVNSTLPKDQKIEYIAWDFHKATKE